MSIIVQTSSYLLTCCW